MNWVPHLRRGLIATKVGYRAEHDPLFRVERVSGFLLPRKLSTLDAFASKMGHPAFEAVDGFVVGVVAVGDRDFGSGGDFELEHRERGAGGGSVDVETEIDLTEAEFFRGGHGGQ